MLTDQSITDTEDAKPQIQGLALSLLARREHSRTELKRKLARRGFEESSIEAVLDQLVAQGWLSDARYVEIQLRKRAQAGYGPMRIREELLQQGIPKSEVEQALKNAACDWFELLQQVWQAKFSGQLPATDSERARQMRFLTYRGFAVSEVLRLWHSSQR